VGSCGCRRCVTACRRSRRCGSRASGCSSGRTSDRGHRGDGGDAGRVGTSCNVDNGAVLKRAGAILDRDGDGLSGEVDIPGQGGSSLLRKGLESRGSGLAAREDAGNVGRDSTGPGECSRLTGDDGGRGVDGELGEGSGGESEGDGEGLHLDCDNECGEVRRKDERDLKRTEEKREGDILVP